MLNLDLKIALIRNFGSQIVAARRLRINQSKLSFFVNGHSEPNERERTLLEKALGRDYFAEGEESQANVKRSVAEILVDQGGSIYAAPKIKPKE
jgi:hypothetical protein